MSTIGIELYFTDSERRNLRKQSFTQYFHLRKLLGKVATRRIILGGYRVLTTKKVSNNTPYKEKVINFYINVILMEEKNNESNK